MYINNISKSISKKVLYFSGILSVISIISLITIYLSTTSSQPSFSGFFELMFYMAKSFIDANPEETLFATIMVLFPVYPFIIFIISFIARYQALKKFNSKLNILAVELKNGLITFIFNRKSHNITYEYKDIDKLEVILHTIWVRTKHGAYMALDEIELKFTILGNKTFSIYNTPASPINFMYKLIDYTRNIENFSYRFLGAGTDYNMKEKIDDYFVKGVKQILTNQQESNFKILSIIFFIVGVGLALFMKDIILDEFESESYTIIIICVISVLISFAFDIFLILDKIRERNF